MQILINVYDVIKRHKLLYDTHYGVVIYRDEVDACTFSSFRGVKTDRQTHTDRQNWAL